MITNTHILYSQIIYKYCLKNLKFKLDKYYFMYGNIKPDIFCNHFKDSHTLNESIDLVFRYSNLLIARKYDIKHFSVILGEICHYVCDYFCLYHTETFSKKNAFSHILYEIKLHIKLRALRKNSKIRPIYNRFPAPRSILSIIYDLQREYFKKRASFNKDIFFSLSASILVCEAIIKGCKNSCNENTAEVS